MNPRSIRHVLIHLYFVCLLLSLQLIPQPAKAKTEDRSWRLFVSAQFNTTDADGCVFTEVYIAAMDDTQLGGGKPERNQSVYINITQGNYCTATTSFIIAGEVTLQPDELYIDKQLESASLNATVLLHNVYTEEIVPAEVHVDWVPIGKAGKGGSYLDAQASGSVLIDGVNYTPEPSYLATMQAGIVKVISASSPGNSFLSASRRSISAVATQSWAGS